MSESSVNRFSRVVAGIGALVLGIALVARQSDNPSVLGRYSLEYLVVLLCFVPLFVAALYVAVRGRDLEKGFLLTLRSPLFWLVTALLVFPVVLVAARYVDSGDGADLKRMAGLSFLLLAFATGCIGIASRGTRGLRCFRLGALTIVGGTYAVSLLITPVLGGWVERELGYSGVSTFDLVKQEEGNGLWRLWYEPNAEFVYAGLTGAIREFSVSVRNNSWGFHDKERSFANPEDRVRVVVLGDGYVRAMEVPLERGFPAVLENMLLEDSDRFEVVRIARRDIGQSGELELLRRYGARLEPDLVILLWATNDLLANDPDLAALRVELPGALLFPGLLIDRLASKWLRKRAYVFNQRLRLGVLRPDYWAELEPMPSPVRHAMEKTEDLLDQILRESESIGSELMLVVKRPSNELRHLSRFPSLREYEFNPAVYDKWLSAYAASRGVHYLDTGPAFQEYYYDHPTGHPDQYSWPNDGHWRGPGHDLAGRLIYDYMVANGLASAGAGP